MASSAVRSVALRLTIDGDQIVLQKLDGVGKGGSAALKRIKDSSKDVPASLKAIDAASSELQSGLGGLASRVGAVGSVLTALGPVGLAVGATLGAIALAAGAAFKETRDAEEFAASLQDTARGLGLTTTEFQELKAAAADTNVPLDKFTSGISQLSQRMEEYRAGVLRAQEENIWKNVLGISREQINDAQTFTEKLLLIADAVQKLPESQQRGVAERLGFADLLPLLDQGRDKIEQMTSAADATGRVMDESVVNKLDEANDKWGASVDIIKNNLYSAVVDLAGPLQKLADWGATFSGYVKDAANALAKPPSAGGSWGDWLHKAWSFLYGGGWGPAGILLGTAKNPFASDQSGDNASAPYSGPDIRPKAKPHQSSPLPPSLADQQAAERARQKAEQAAKAAEALAERQKVSSAQIDTDIARANAGLISAQDALNVALLKGKQGYYDAVLKQAEDEAEAEKAVAIAAAKAQIAALDKLYKNDPTQLAAQSAKISDALNAQLKTIDLKSQAQQVEIAREAAGALSQLADQINGPLNTALQNVGADELGRFTDNLAEVVSGAKSVKDAISDMVQSILQDLAKLVLQREVEAPLAKGLDSLIPSISSFLGSLFGAGHAGGGPVSAGKVYPVNESGGFPEMLRANGASYVLTSAQSLDQVASAAAARVRPGVAVMPSQAPQVIINNNTGMAVEAQQHRDSSTGITTIDLKRSATEQQKSNIRGGVMDKAFRDRFGLTPAPRPR